MDTEPVNVLIDGTEVRRVRKEAGHSQIALAAIADISSPYLSQIETGVRTSVSPAVHKRLRDALGLTDPRALLAERVAS